MTFVPLATTDGFTLAKSCKKLGVEMVEVTVTAGSVVVVVRVRVVVRSVRVPTR